ncbi:DUF4157 domain-containing protein [Fulvivirga sp. 29W222]|uniref:DUF4157 domain-containing protein n=1 Tax=Fulvivirga marina TaxID=2494733 RepID=A0A937G068_9BACT|nr:DUF4157 domain-containing protein [Fulvivirga marina]MBL6449394.1 DUF4157 domain-containing protein [Fulvivirga marina]
MNDIQHQQQSSPSSTPGSKQDNLQKDNLSSSSLGIQQLFGQAGFIPVQKASGNMGGGQASEAPTSSNKGSGGLPEVVKGKMEGAFGASFEDVKVHSNSSQAKQIGALAYAQGNDIHFAPGQYNPHSVKGQELIGHELAHVVQQRQGRVKATTQAKGLVVNDDPVLEQEADSMGYKAARNQAVSGGVTVQKKAQDDVVQKNEIEGPWNKGDPVHENLTLQSLIKAGVVPKDASLDDEEVFEYIRGVIWNDDPEGLLFDNNERENDNYSSGLVWYNHFSDGKGKSKKGERIGKKDNMTARSHFGDLQFFHAMAIADGIKAQITKDKVMVWAEFTYRVGIGDIKSNTTLTGVPVAGFTEYFKGTPNADKLTIDDLFHTYKDGSTPKRAMGSLMHMIQDSHAHGHAERAEEKGDDSIKSFHSYVNQDGHKHGEHDKGNGDYSYEGLSKLKGAKSAMDKGAQVFKYYKAKTPWSEVKVYLDTQVFNLVERPTDSGPGEEFKVTKD